MNPATEKNIETLPVEPKLRVLLLAEACNPQWNSVPLLAYYWYAALRARVDLTLVTQIRNKHGLIETDGHRDHVVYIDTERVAVPLSKMARMITRGHPTALGIRNAVRWFAYVSFERLVWKHFRRSILGGDFDLVHRLTPLSPTFPSPIAARCPVPFILGPLNGSLPWAAGTESIRRREGEWLAPVRSIYRTLPYWRQTFECSDLVIAAGEHVRRELPGRARKRSVILAENGVDTFRFPPGGGRPIAERNPFTILFVGRLVSFKQPALILEAVARMPPSCGDLCIRYVGEGPERDTITRAAERLGLTKQVELVGQVAHERLRRYYQTASVLVLPSVHESGGAVLLEAMACGLPCVVANYGGPAEYINDRVGVRIPLCSPEQMAAQLSEVLARFQGDRSALERLSLACVDEVRRRWSWDAKADRLVSLYRSVLAKADP